MSSSQSINVILGLTAVVSSSAQATFVGQPDDSLIEDFNDGFLDIVDFGQFAGAFGQDPNELYQWTHDFSGGQCCFPSSLGIGIQAHNAGTVWADYVHIFGDGTTASEHSPDLPLPSR